MDSRFIAAALTGMTIDRYAIISRKPDRITTPPMKIGRLWPICTDRSIMIAVRPATWASMSSPVVACGRTSTRNVLTSSWVAGSAGPVVGITWITATPPSGLTMGSPTSATPGVSFRRSAVEVNRSS